MNHWNEGFAGQGWPGMCPAEGVADKTAGRSPRTWERGGDFPLLAEFPDFPLADFTLEKVGGYAIIYCGLGKKELIFSI